MKSAKPTTHRLNGILLTLLLLGVNQIAEAKNKDCWGEFFDGSSYKGQSMRLEGPVKKKDLLDIDGENWDMRIHSLKVGPKAKVTVYENKNFKMTMTEMAKHPVLMKSLGITKQDILEESELIFTGDSKVHDLGDFNFHHKIRSLKIECTK